MAIPTIAEKDPFVAHSNTIAAADNNSRKLIISFYMDNVDI